MVAVVCLAHAAAPPPAEQADRLLAAVTEGTKHAAAAVTSGRGKVTARNWNLSPLSEDGTAAIELKSVYKAAFSGGEFRLSVTTTVLRYDPVKGQDPVMTPAVGSERREEIAVCGNRATDFTRDEGPRAIVASLDGETRASKQVSDTARHCMRQVKPSGLGLPGHGITDIGRITFAGEPSVASIIRRVTGREVVNGDECLVLELTVRRADKKLADSVNLLWIDPRKGYTVTRMRHYLEGGPFAGRILKEEENVVAKKYAPGIWYPSKVVNEYYEVNAKGKPVKTSTSTITYDPGFKLNVPVTEADLSLYMPSGTRVRDETVGKDYTVP
jgi:hypothetical protein